MDNRLQKVRAKLIEMSNRMGNYTLFEFNDILRCYKELVEGNNSKTVMYATNRFYIEQGFMVESNGIAFEILLSTEKEDKSKATYEIDWSIRGIEKQYKNLDYKTYKSITSHLLSDNINDTNVFEHRKIVDNIVVERAYGKEEIL